MFVLEEAVLRYRLTDIETHQGQLDHLLQVMRLPSVSLGVIPFVAHREDVRPMEGFVIFGDELVSVELLSGHLQITQPREIADYVHAFFGFASIAAYGNRARALIESAKEALGR